eukprot:228053-Chlamydomonas_euryale.AAC.1
MLCSTLLDAGRKSGLCGPQAPELPLWKLCRNRQQRRWPSTRTRRVKKGGWEGWEATEEDSSYTVLNNSARPGAAQFGGKHGARRGARTSVGRGGRSSSGGACHKPRPVGARDRPRAIWQLLHALGVLPRRQQTRPPRARAVRHKCVVADVLVIGHEQSTPLGAHRRVQPVPVVVRAGRRVVERTPGLEAVEELAHLGRLRRCVLRALAVQHQHRLAARVRRDRGVNHGDELPPREAAAVAVLAKICHIGAVDEQVVGAVALVPVHVVLKVALALLLAHRERRDALRKRVPLLLVQVHDR